MSCMEGRVDFFLQVGHPSKQSALAVHTSPPALRIIPGSCPLFQSGPPAYQSILMLGLCSLCAVQLVHGGHEGSSIIACQRVRFQSCFQWSELLLCPSKIIPLGGFYLLPAGKRTTKNKLQQSVSLNLVAPRPVCMTWRSGTLYPPNQSIRNVLFPDLCHLCSINWTPKIGWNIENI